MLKRLEEAIKNANKIVFFGGAGVSTESGLRDFRGEDGLSHDKTLKYSPEVLLSINFFNSNTLEFYDEYRKMFFINQAKPNAAHEYLAMLEESGKNITIITQNIDNLHQLAGSTNVLELHGSIYRNYGIKTLERVDGISHLINTKGIPKTDSGDIVRPDVVLYGEQLDNNVTSKAINALSNADLLIVAGTSLSVYPAANMIHYFKGDNIFAINRDYIPIKNYIQGDIGKIFKKFKEKL